MSLIFVWTPSDRILERPEASGRARFRATMESLETRCSEAFRRPFQCHAKLVGTTWIGQLTADHGISGWESWLVHGTRGVAWSGVCESFLGRSDPESVATEVARTVLERPETTAAWQGSFAVATWHEAARDIALLTSAAEPQPLWEARGPDGWAAGTRARPLLDLVGRSPELAKVQASIYLGFGFLAGDGSLFEGVERVPARSRIRVRRDRAGQRETYLSVPDFLARTSSDDREFEQVVRHEGDRLRERVARQRRHTPDPMLSLTGGRDSRCIAAALHASGYSVPAQTGGATDSQDVVVAANVARRLGLEHHAGEGGTDTLSLLTRHMDRAQQWTELTEGIETIRHAMHFRRFFEAPEQIRDEVRPTFNGLTGGLLSRSWGAWGPDAVLDRIGPELLASSDAKDALATTIARFEHAAGAAGGGRQDLPELLYWALRAQRWGMDNVSAKFGLTWWWTPLMDGSLVRATWWLPRETKSSKRFVEALTTYLAPTLSGVPYERGNRPARIRRVWNRVRRAWTKALVRADNGSLRTKTEAQQQWEGFLFEREALVWPQLIDEAYVRTVIAGRPNDNLLWSLATIELFAEAHLRPSHAAGGPKRPTGTARDDPATSS